MIKHVKANWFLQLSNEKDYQITLKHNKAPFTSKYLFRNKNNTFKENNILKID